MDVKGAKNEAVTTIFPLRSALKSRAPGVYLLIARDAAKKKPSPIRARKSGPTAPRNGLSTPISA